MLVEGAGVALGGIGGRVLNWTAKSFRLPHFKPIRWNGNKAGWSFGRSYGAVPRIDFHKLGRASKQSNSITIPKLAPFMKDWKLLHYHRGKGNNLQRHRPWEKGWNDKNFWSRF